MKTFFGNGSGPKFGKIIAMDRFDSGRSLSPIRQAESYWTALLGDDGVPRRSQIDPRGLENILEYTFILERIAPGLARFRLAGSHLSKIAGMEVRGMPLTAFFEPSSRHRITEELEKVFSEPAVGEFALISKGKLGRVRLEARMILLPLRSDLGDVSRILGILVSEGAIGATPRRFSIETSRVRPLVSVQRQADKLRLESGFAEEQTEFGGAAGHLKLVHSRDD